MQMKVALVPEGYLEAVRLDWEDEEGCLITVFPRNYSLSLTPPSTT